MSSDTTHRLEDDSNPQGRRGGSAGTAEYMEAQVTVHRAGGSPQELRIEVTAQNFRRRPEVTLVSRLQDSDIDLEEAERIEVKIRGERLTLKQTRWEMQR